mgnify:CR=1 FL=1
MLRTKLFFSIMIFSILFSVTSIIKTQTRIIEKKITKIQDRIVILERDLHETELDFDGNTIAVERNKGVMRKDRPYTAMLTDRVKPITSFLLLNKNASNFSLSSVKFNSWFSIGFF